jgi:selenoprotein W-related protein
MKSKLVVEIYYCTQCRWLLRASWYANELLTTFQDQLGGVCLKPSSGGMFQIFVDEKKIWCRKENNGFPDIKELKQKVRDIVDPDMSLGHSES